MFLNEGRNSGQPRPNVKTINDAIDSLNQMIVKIEDTLHIADELSGNFSVREGIKTHPGIEHAGYFPLEHLPRRNGVSIRSVSFTRCEFSEERQCLPVHTLAPGAAFKAEIYINPDLFDHGPYSMRLIDPACNRAVILASDSDEKHDRVILNPGINTIALKCRLYQNKLYKMDIESPNKFLVSVWLKVIFANEIM